MSITAIGPALNIDGPLPQPPPQRLLAVPGVLRDIGEFGGRWRNGVNVWGYISDVPYLWEPCSTGTYRTKDDDADWDQPRFDPFVAYLPMECSTITADPAEFARRTEQVVDATISFAVEEALSIGVVGSTNPYFGDTGLTVLSGAAVNPRVGLSYLEDAIGATGRGGMIHATPATVAAWDQDLDFVDGALRTANGTPVASGGGYIGAQPVGYAEPAAGSAWAYATGPVHVYVEDADEPTVKQFVDQTDNTATYRAERWVLALWDTSLQAGVLIDWTA